MSNHIMLDLETFGTGNKAVIVAIGAVMFDPDEPMKALNKFYCAVDPASCVAHGLEMDAATVMWWMHKDRTKARNLLLDSEQLDLPSALDGFSEWFGKESLPVWGNGATFDNVIIRSAFAAVRLPCPWHFGHDRCYRTLKNLDPSVLSDDVNIHHALADAEAQTKHLLKLASIIRLKLS